MSSSSTGPSPAQQERNVKQWAELNRTALTRVTDTASKWVTALAAFVAIITAAFVIKGPDTFAEIPEPVNNWVLIGIVAHAVLMIVGLWLAQTAATPGQQLTTWEDFNQANTADYKVENASARAALRRLTLAKAFVALGLVALIATLVLWATAQAPESATLLSVSSEGEVICGEVVAQDDGLRLIIPMGDEDGVLIDLDTVSSASVVDACP